MNLFSELKIKNITTKNRIVLPPLVRFSMIGKDGFVTETLLKWYEDIAAAGVGMIIVEACCVSVNGKLRENQLGIWSDTFLDGLTKISKIGKKYTVPMLIQIHHAGFQENISSVDEKILDNILKDFTNAFFRAKEAGFDGIEIHGAHSYLISQLSSRLYNTRSDKYGGSFEKRMYFVTELLKKTKNIFNDNFILGYRIGGNEPELEDGIKIAKYLEKIGVDIIHVSSGIPNPNRKEEKKVDVPADFKFDWVVYMGIEIRKHVSVPVIGVRKIKTEKQASYLIENNLLDLVAIGRAMIGKPKWVSNAKSDYFKRTGNVVK